MDSKIKIPYSLIKTAEVVKGRTAALTTQFPLQGANLDQPFFIVGSGRAGNTMLRAMLVASEQLVIPPESYVIPRVTRIFLAYGYLPWKILASAIIAEFETFETFYTWDVSLLPALIKVRSLAGNERSLANIIDLIYREYAKKFNKENLRWGDKTPKNAEFLEHVCDLFPNADYVHLIRDPRAVFYSYLESGLKKGRTKAEKNNIIDTWLNSHQHIQRCKSKLGTKKFHTLHYENMVSNPNHEIAKISCFLKIKSTQKMLNFWKLESLGDVNIHSHHANVLKPLNLHSLDKWKNGLSNSDIQLVEKHCMPLYRKLCSQYPLNPYD